MMNDYVMVYRHLNGRINSVLIVAKSHEQALDTWDAAFSGTPLLVGVIDTINNDMRSIEELDTPRWRVAGPAGSVNA